MQLLSASDKGGQRHLLIWQPFRRFHVNISLPPAPICNPEKYCLAARQVLVEMVEAVFGANHFFDVVQRSAEFDARV